MDIKLDVGQSFQAIDDFHLKLSMLAASTEDMAREAIYEGAKIIADEVRKNLEANIKDQESAAKSGLSIFKKPRLKPTGDLERSFGITPIKRGKDGNWDAKIGFSGYDSKGIPNQLKARVMESGSSKIKPRPFVRPAVTATRSRAIDAMRQKIHEKIKRIMKG